MPAELNPWTQQPRLCPSENYRNQKASLFGFVAYRHLGLRSRDDYEVFTLNNINESY